MNIEHQPETIKSMKNQNIVNDSEVQIIASLAISKVKLVQKGIKYL